MEIQLFKGCIILPLHSPQSRFRIADKHGNHAPKPTEIKNEKKYDIEWMITNREIGLLSHGILGDVHKLIEEMDKIKKFVEDSEYSKRATKSDGKEIAVFEGFKIYQYDDIFYSFEKTLESGLKVRLTFKSGEFGIVTHSHMYVLIPFDCNSLKLKNRDGNVNQGASLGSGCIGELILTKDDIKEIIITLSHASIKHRDDLIKVLKS